MANRYLQYGLTDEDVAGAMAWEAFARKSGLPRKRVEDGLRWYGRNREKITGMSAQEIAESFRADHGNVWGERELTQAATFHDTALSNPAEYFLPKENEHAARLAELEGMVADPNSDYHTGANARDLQTEYLALLEMAEQGGSMPAPSVVAQPETAPPPPRTGRLAELEAMVANAASDYYTGKNASALRREYLALLEAGTPGEQAPQDFAGGTGIPAGETGRSVTADPGGAATSDTSQGQTYEAFGDVDVSWMTPSNPIANEG